MFLNNKGYLFLEAIMAIMVFSCTSAMALPVLYKLYLEKSTILQEQKAIEWIENAAVDYERTGRFQEGMKREGSTLFRFSILPSYSKEMVRLCVNFTGSNKRSYTKCKNV